MNEGHCECVKYVTGSKTVKSHIIFGERLIKVIFETMKVKIIQLNVISATLPYLLL